MSILGAVLLIIGFVVGVPVLWSIRIALVVIGGALALLGSAGRRIGGRAHLAGHSPARPSTVDEWRNAPVIPYGSRGTGAGTPPTASQRVFPNIETLAPSSSH